MKYINQTDFLIEDKTDFSFRVIKKGQFMYNLELNEDKPFIVNGFVVKSKYNINNDGGTPYMSLLLNMIDD